MSKHTFGLVNVEIGAIESDGGMGLSLTAVGETVSGTATMTTTEPTKTDFKIEESDSPIESVVTDPGTVEFAWSTYNVDGPTLVKFFGGTYTGVGSILTLGSITGGSSYTNGTYTNVALASGSGTGAKATIVISGGAVTSVTITDGGIGYADTDSVGVVAANVGGTGSGFIVPIDTVTTTAKYEFPDAVPDIEQSIKITDKKGNVVKLPRAKISAKMGLSFSKDKLGQVDLKATVLQPSKAGEKRMTITYA